MGSMKSNSSGAVTNFLDSLLFDALIANLNKSWEKKQCHNNITGLGELCS
jgi:hypothetical protein